MKIFLASPITDINLIISNKIPFILETFLTFKSGTITPRIKKLLDYIPLCDTFILDSGAFTYMNDPNKKINDLDEYIQKYIDFINKYDIKYFFEMDLDHMIGYTKVKEYRKLIEKKTGKKPIPVWHKSRGLDDFKQMIKDYKYVAIGGLVTKEITKKEYPYLKKLVTLAHKNNCRIHGLGFTNLELANDTGFDSVDSTSWLVGSRYGVIHLFEDNRIKIIKPLNKRGKDYKKFNEQNLKAWRKAVYHYNTDYKIENINKIVALISYVKSKNNGTFEAKNLYNSSLFLKSYKYAKTKTNEIYILSAKYGLIKDSDIIESYDETLLDKTKDERIKWSEDIIKDLKSKFDFNKTKFIILAGKSYNEFILTELINYELPLKDLPIGKRLQELDKLNKL